MRGKSGFRFTQRGLWLNCNYYLIHFLLLKKLSCGVWGKIKKICPSAAKRSPGCGWIYLLYYGIGSIIHQYFLLIQLHYFLTFCSPFFVGYLAVSCFNFRNIWDKVHSRPSQFSVSMAGFYKLISLWIAIDSIVWWYNYHGIIPPQSSIEGKGNSPVSLVAQALLTVGFYPNGGAELIR